MLKMSKDCNKYRKFVTMSKNCNKSKSNNMTGQLKLIVSWLDGKEIIKCQCQSIISINSG